MSTTRDEINSAAQFAGWEIGLHDNGDTSYQRGRVEIVVRYSTAGNVTKGYCRIACDVVGELKADKKATLLGWLK
jgi:hypothetical protein